MNKQKFNDYFLGLDIGTSSVGWAVTDEDYNIIRFNKKDMWGSHLFSEANTAKKEENLDREEEDYKEENID